MRLLLIDGHYYAYRSYFAIRELSNSRGEPTNAIYGFVKTVRRMLKDLQPDLAAVIWDEGLPERRTRIQPQYKQQRAEMPEPMRPQLDFIRNIVPFLGVQSLGLANHEADDLMASYAEAAARESIDTVLATNDKDLFQLVNDRILIYSTHKADLATPKDAFALLGHDAVRAKWGVEPQQISGVLSLIGDSVDNIPGVGGVGPKTAAALFQNHPDLAHLLANLSSVSNLKLRAKLESAREQILQNQEMVRLDLDLPLPMAVSELRIEPRYDELITALETCEFRSLLAEIKAEAEKLSAANSTTSSSPRMRKLANHEVGVPATQGELF